MVVQIYVDSPIMKVASSVSPITSALYKLYNVASYTFTGITTSAAFGLGVGQGLVAGVGLSGFIVGSSIGVLFGAMYCMNEKDKKMSDDDINKLALKAALSATFFSATAIGLGTAISLLFPHLILPMIIIGAVCTIAGIALGAAGAVREIRNGDVTSTMQNVKSAINVVLEGEQKQQTLVVAEQQK
jgi:hypothetical protein